MAGSARKVRQRRASCAHSPVDTRTVDPWMLSHISREASGDSNQELAAPGRCNAAPHSVGRSIRLPQRSLSRLELTHRLQNDRVNGTAIGTIPTRPSSISRDSITLDKSVNLA